MFSFCGLEQFQEVMTQKNKNLDKADQEKWGQKDSPKQKQK